MKIMDWTIIEPAGGGDRLPAGGYVCTILDAVDNPSREFLEIYYDIAEGEYAGHYSDDWSKANPWSHKLVWSYKDKAQPFFKQRLDALETSNKHINGFTVAEWTKTCNEKQFVGLQFGGVFQYEKYTNRNGDDKERLQCEKVIPAQDVRNGEFTLPEVKDSREKAEAAPAASNFNLTEDVPF